MRQLARASLGPRELAPLHGFGGGVNLNLGHLAALAYAQAYAECAMSLERHVKLFRNGRNQAVRIPREFELPGEDAIIRKEGDRLIIEICPPRSLLAVLASLSSLSEDFQSIADPVPDPVDL
jgi:antitoxin VapB